MSKENKLAFDAFNKALRLEELIINSKKSILNSLHLIRLANPFKEDMIVKANEGNHIGKSFRVTDFWMNRSDEGLAPISYTSIGYVINKDGSESNRTGSRTVSIKSVLGGNDE